MHMPRRALVGTAVALVLGSLGQALAQQPGFPNKPVTIVVPYNAGGGTDGTARAIAKGLSQVWGQPVIVENVGGADGLIGTQKVARAAADGYTVVISVPNLLLFKHSKNSNNFSATASLAPLSLVATYPVVVIASNASGIKNVADLQAKCKSGSCSWGSGEQFSWLAGVSVLDAMGVKATNVPYRGTAPVVNDVLGGHLALGVGALASPLPHHKNGALKVVAGFAKTRPASAPDVPTLVESGVTGVSITDPWYGLFAPKGVPPAVMAAWHKGLQQLHKDASVMGALGVVNADPVLSSPEEFARQVAADEKAFDALVAVHPLPQ